MLTGEVVSSDSDGDQKMDCCTCLNHSLNSSVCDRMTEPMESVGLCDLEIENWMK